jgi:adenylate kinase
MAPITDEIVSGLKDTISSLEARVVELESRLTGHNKPKSVTEQMRIILMGPPGAGMLRHYRQERQWLLTRC